MQETDSSRSKAPALIGIVVLFLFAGSPAQSAVSTARVVTSPPCHGPKCPVLSKHAHTRRGQAIKVKIDPPPPERVHPDQPHPTGGPVVNPGH